MDSGSSKDVEIDSPSRPLGPSGEACIELLHVMSWFICGDMMGDWGTLEVTEPELTADVGIDTEELIVGSEEVWSFVVGLTRRDVEGSCDCDCDCIAIVDCCGERRSGGGGGEDLKAAGFDIL